MVWASNRKADVRPTVLYISSRIFVMRLFCYAYARSLPSSDAAIQAVTAVSVGSNTLQQTKGTTGCTVWFPTNKFK